MVKLSIWRHSFWCGRGALCVDHFDFISLICSLSETILSQQVLYRWVEQFMSNLFKNLKSIFVVDAQGQKTPDTSTAEPTSAEVKKPQSGHDSEVEVEISDSGEGEVSEKFTEILLKAIEANNQQGFDYIEYKRSLQNLSKMEMDEGTSYKSAYAAAQTMGVTPASLVESANRYLSVLQKEEGKFEAALGKQKGKQVDGGLERIGELETAIREKETKINELTQQIEADKDELSRMKQEVEQAGRKVQKTKVDFIASYNSLVSQIHSDIEKIKKYLS